MGQGSSQPAHLQNSDLLHDPEPGHNTDMHSEKPESSPPSPVNKPDRESHPPNGSLTKRKRNQSQSVATPVAAASPEDNPSSLKRKRVVDNLGKEKTPTPNVQRNMEVSNSQRTPVNRSSTGPASGLYSKEISTGRLNRALSAAANGSSPARSTVSEVVRKGRLHRPNGEASKSGVTGAFGPEEVEALEGFKVRFCNSYGLSMTAFDLLVQHGKGPFHGPPEVTKHTFWQEIHGILPNRDKRSVRRFMKRHFQASSQKPHEWTEEQEDELVVLYHQHGPKWAHISEMLGRSSDDVVQRWKNRLEHRSTMNTGPWSEAEVSLMKKVLRGAWSKMQEQGYDVGDNIYEMDESLISWGQVSVGMKHTRSRQQCADKWRRIKGSMATQGSRANSRATSRANSQSMSRSATPLQANRDGNRVRKSTAYVISDDDSDAPGDDAKRGKDAAPKHSIQMTPSIQASNNLKKIEPKGDESDSSSESDSDSESETKSKPGSATLNEKTSSPGEKTAAQESNQSSTSSSSDSDSDSDSSSDSDSNSGSKPASQKHTEPTESGGLKQEASSDESDDSSSSEEESESENEAADEIPATPSAEPTTEKTSKDAKRKRSNSATKEAAEPGDKRVKVKTERSPTPSAVVAPEHKSDSNEQDTKKTNSSSESETSSDSDTESDSSESSAGDNPESKNAPPKRTPESKKDDAKTNSLSGYDVSDSDADSTSSSDSEDESKDDSKVSGKAEPAGTTLASKRGNDDDSSSDETSSSGSSSSSSDSDSDSDSDSE